MLGKAGGGPMVSHVDPDTPTREGKTLHPLDEVSKVKVNLIIPLGTLAPTQTMRSRNFHE
jgi:hypothetical protein